MKRTLYNPISSPVINGEKPPIPVPLINRLETPYRYVASSVLRSCSLINLLTILFSFCKVTKLFLPDNGKQGFYLILQELILFSQQLVFSSQGSITTY